MSVHAGCPIILARTADMFMMCSADFGYHPACTYIYVCVYVCIYRSFWAVRGESCVGWSVRGYMVQKRCFSCPLTQA